MCARVYQQQFVAWAMLSHTRVVLLTLDLVEDFYLCNIILRTKSVGIQR
jgi:hypothetical protein